MIYLYLALGILLAAAAWLALRSISDQAGIDDLIDETENELK